MKDFNDFSKQITKEAEKKRDNLLKECEAIEKEIKDKENLASKRISQLESESETYISKIKKEIDAKLRSVDITIKSLEGSEEKLAYVDSEIKKLDNERKLLDQDKKEFEVYKSKEHQELDKINKALLLREAKLKEINA